VHYYFEVVWDDDPSESDATTDDTWPPRKGKAMASKKIPDSEGRRNERRDSPIDRSPAPGLVGTANDEAW
jgi:hypothetical protein